MNEPAFSSLTELLASIAGKSFDEVHGLADIERSIASSQIKEIQHTHKKHAIRVNPNLVEYFDGLCMLLCRLDDPATFCHLPDGYTKQQIESALRKLRLD
jgi:hypothetical protein